MKKTAIILLSYIVIPGLLAAQGKEGNVWMLGYPASPGFEKPYLGGSSVRFNNGGIDTLSFNVGGEMSSSTSISDDNGNLLFYSNGCEMYNREYQIMQNGNAITATRHGNGQDWWITFPGWRTNNYLVFLLDSLGLHGPDIQSVGAFPMGSGGYGQSTFSPDGSKYAEICFFQGQVLDFDRCSGKFSNARVINYDTIGGNQCGGVAFSPNSRYMYVSRCDSIFQFDMSVTDFNSTKQTIAQFDGIFDSTGLKGPGFYTLLNGPDDKIYINTPSSTKAFYIIQKPNESGTTLWVACS